MLTGRTRDSKVEKSTKRIIIREIRSIYRSDKEEKREDREKKQGSGKGKPRGKKGWGGGDLLSHAITHAVPSALRSLTTVFGMGTGVTSSLEPPPQRAFCRKGREGCLDSPFPFFLFLQGPNRGETCVHGVSASDQLPFFREDGQASRPISIG
jgi:hypothetical protein